MAATRDEGLVYYALDATRREQYLKIGYSTKLRQRMQDLRAHTTSAQIPLVLALEEGGIQRERMRHDQFAAYRSHGEWFRYEGDLVKAVAEMEHPVSYLLDRPGLWQFADGWATLPPSSSARSPQPERPTKAEAPPMRNVQRVRTSPLPPGHYLNEDGIEVGPDGLPPIDF